MKLNYKHARRQNTTEPEVRFTPTKNEATEAKSDRVTAEVGQFPEKWCVLQRNKINE